MELKLVTGPEGVKLVDAGGAVVDGVYLSFRTNTKCTVCGSEDFTGMIDDTYGNTIPCWGCNLLELEYRSTGGAGTTVEVSVTDLINSIKNS